jgi:hypothetical protein
MSSPRRAVGWAGRHGFQPGLEPMYFGVVVVWGFG